MCIFHVPNSINRKFTVGCLVAENTMKEEQAQWKVTLWISYQVGSVTQSIGSTCNLLSMFHDKGVGTDETQSGGGTGSASLFPNISNRLKTKTQPWSFQSSVFKCVCSRGS